MTRPARLQLSVLDQSPVKSGSTPADAIAETLELAQAADRLGYHRYWLAEHHATPGLAGTSPEVLIARVAGLTHGLRVGAGGVMLSHYSALHVAEQFRVLEALYPGRVDLGIGRAPGSDARTAHALRHGPGALPLEAFPDQLADLLAWVHDRLPPGHPFAGIRAMPVGPTAPEVWILGSSDEGGVLAARFGTAFAYAHFISAEGGAEVAQAYRRAFQPSPERREPRVAVAAFALCADTEAEARRLLKSRDLFLVRLYTGRTAPYPSVEEVEAYPFTDRELAIVQHTRQRSIAGTPAQVRERLEALAREYGADELVIVTITHDAKARLRSYELLAEAFELAPRRDPASAAVP